MNYKEKYEQALERARQFSERPYLEDSAWIVEYIFPELKESKDERIKDRLINYFHGFLDGHEDTYKVGGCVKWEGLDVKDVITWLEKQGDENIVVVIPKFRVGDVIRPKDSAAEYTIESISGECYHGKGWGLPISCDNDYELVEQKPAEWSEYDEEFLLELSQCCDLNKTQVQWLLSLKDRVQPQPKQEWSEEDEVMLQFAIEHFEIQKRNSFEDGLRKKQMQEFIDWLKSIRHQSHWKPNNEQIEALETTLYSNMSRNDERYSVLSEFVAELKKLKD